MQIKDKQYYIYIRSARQRVYVTKEQFEEYYREINRQRVRVMPECSRYISL